MIDRSIIIKIVERYLGENKYNAGVGVLPGRNEDKQAIFKIFFNGAFNKYQYLMDFWPKVRYREDPIWGELDDAFVALNMASIAPGKSKNVGDVFHWMGISFGIFLASYEAVLNEKMNRIPSGLIQRFGSYSVELKKRSGFKDLGWLGKWLSNIAKKHSKDMSADKKKDIALILSYYR